MVRFVVIAMQKCCNHGIINWIGKQSKETLLFSNCNYKQIWNNTELEDMKIRTEHKVEGSRETHYLFNVEEFDLNYFNELKDKLIFNSKPTVLIFGRDPFNWMASCYNNKFTKPQKTRYTKLTASWNPAFAPYLHFGSRIDTYKQHMKEVMCETSYLDGYDVVFINYNKWFLDDEYRNSLSDRLDINRGTKGMNWGHDNLFLYSSFREVNTPQNRNDVLNRYKIFKSDKEFRSLCNDQELIRIAKELFDFVPDWSN